MKHRTIWQKYLLVTAFWLLCLWVSTATTWGGQQRVQLDALTIDVDRAAGAYVAEQEVVLQWGDQELRADRLLWFEEAREAQAFGQVHFIDPDSELFGDEMHLNLITGLGRVHNGRILVREPRFHITGSTLSKTGPRSYRVEDGTFTGCDGPVPAWKFTASQLDVTLEGYAWARNAKFYIYDVPVLYLPVIGYPVKTRRQSGLLMPGVGYSDKRGAQLYTSYYHVIAPNQDSTLYLDYLSRMGVGKGLEYRYFFGHDNEGAAKAYHVSGLNNYADRFAFDWRHRGTLPGRVRLRADVEYVSQRDFFSDFGEAAGDYNKDKTESVIWAGRNWGKNNLAGQVKYTRDLQRSNAETLQRLPEVRFSLLRRRFADSPFYFDLETSAVHFYRDQGLTGGRLSLRPSVAGVFRLGGFLDVSTEFGYRERLYSSDQGEERDGRFDVATLLSTRLSRVYNIAGRRVERLQHVLQPEIRYGYRPFEKQSHLPQFDGEDSLSGQNTFSYGLVNRLVARSETVEGQVDYREWLYLRLAQEYDIEKSERHPLAPQGQERRFSDLRAELIVRPTRWNYIDIDTRYDTAGSNNFFTFHVDTGLQDQRGNALSLRYRYNKDLQEYLAARLELALLKPLYLSYENRHSLRGDTNLENRLNLEYRAQCWSLYLTYRNRDGDQNLSVSFALAGLGRSDQPGSRRQPL